jgi:alcohol dehydrogenase
MWAATVSERNAVWKVQQVNDPKPGPGQVLIKIHASGLCYTDVHITQGTIPVPKFPCVLGHEPVGEVVELGVGVTSRRVGDRVGVPWVQDSCGRCEFCLRGKPNFCPEGVGTGIAIWGGHAEYMVAFAKATVLIPAAVSWEQAAPIFCAGYTVWSGLRWANPRPGERVAVAGIGGLGHLAVQYAHAAGFETIAVTHSPDKIALAKALGADHVVGDGAGLASLGGADVVLATTNSSAQMTDMIKGIRPDGRLMVIGADAKPISLSPMELLMKRIQIIGSQQNHPEHLFEALDFVAKGKVKVHTETFPLRDVEKAYQRVADGSVRFRAVLTI